MGDVIDFESRKKQIEEITDKDYLPIGTITFDDLFIDVVDPKDFISHIDAINRELGEGMFMEHIANLMEICSYNVDWTQAPDWHKDMFDRAVQFYKDHYNIDK